MLKYIIKLIRWISLLAICVFMDKGTNAYEYGHLFSILLIVVYSLTVHYDDF